MGDYVVHSLRLEQLISDTIKRSTEIILQRNGTIQPLYNDKEKENKTSIEYISECSTSFVTLWKQDYISPLFIDVYISSDQVDRELLLIERWRILFQKNDDNKDNRVNTINRKVVTFLRSLQCFTRLLPGFLLLNYTTSLPSLYFDAYTPSTQINNCTFSVETSSYHLPMVIHDIMFNIINIFIITIIFLPDTNTKRNFVRYGAIHAGTSYTNVSSTSSCHRFLVIIKNA